VGGTDIVVIIDAPSLDAAPPTTKLVRKKPKPRKPGSRPEPVPVPVPEPVNEPAAPTIPTPTPVSPGRCAHAPNPSGCPAAEPNVNRPCDAEGVRCTYGSSCCPIVYVCNGGAFEAWFSTCP
jgi:hypothetical protein